MLQAVFPLDLLLTTPLAVSDSDSEDAAVPLPSSPTFSEAMGMTPLMAAAAAGHTEVLRELMSRGASVEQADSWGNTALMHACSTAKSSDCILALAEQLRARGEGGQAALNKSNRMLVTPLHGACENGLADAALGLIRAGANLEARTRSGETPLIKAAQKGDANIEVVKALLSSGASVHATDNRGKTALDATARVR
jgi:uncharacterized protein